MIGVDETPEGIPTALLAALEDSKPVYADSAFVTLPAGPKDRFWRYLETKPAKRSPIAGMKPH